MQRHTPGPWSIVRRDGNRVDINSAPDETPEWQGLAQVWVRMEDEAEDCEDGLANARLIAAAPDLLAALKAAEHFIGAGYQPPELVDQISAAIRKAEGG